MPAWLYLVIFIILLVVVGGLVIQLLPFLLLAGLVVYLINLFSQHRQIKQQEKEARDIREGKVPSSVKRIRDAIDVEYTETVVPSERIEDKTP